MDLLVIFILFFAGWGAVSFCVSMYNLLKDKYFN
jgi:hypothetical protein